MSTAVNTIAAAITTESLWAQVGNIMPVATIVTLFAFGFYLIKRQLKKVSNGKGGI